MSFLILGFLGRIVEGIGAGLMQTAALAEATAQYKNDEHKVVTWIEFSEEFGQFAGLLFGAFFSHIFGFIGPFSVMCVVFSVFAFFQNDMILFEKSNNALLDVERDNNQIEMAFVQKSTPPEE